MAKWENGKRLLIENELCNEQEIDKRRERK